MKNYKEILSNFYSIHNPTKINEVASLLNKYKGKEDLLFDRISKKYNVDPKEFISSNDKNDGNYSAYVDDLEY